MNNDIKRAAEEILGRIKKNGGIIFLDKAEFIDDPFVYEHASPALRLLESHQLIKHGKNDRYDITPKGADFKSFDAYDRETEEKKKHNERTRELTQRQLFLVKYWWLPPIITALLGLFVGRLSC